jgi:two-component system chemotaxis response regulator CheB
VGAPPAVVAVAASAGGVEALSKFVSPFPADFPGAVLVVMHISPASTSVLPRILARAGKLPVRHPVDGEPLPCGVILVAPPDRHMVVADSSIRLLTAARENGHRPSADVLLRSVAQNCGARSAGVVLSGTMDDGAQGLRAVRMVGGLTLVQDPDQAAFPGMPLAAIAEAGPHSICGATAMVDVIADWVTRLVANPPENRVAGAAAEVGDPAELTALTCPECGGTLWLHEEYGGDRFRCRVGHSFSAHGLLPGKKTALESALWAAMVALEERADLSRRIVQRLRQAGRTSRLGRYEQDATAALQRARFLRGLVAELVQEANVIAEDETDDARTTS